jgi:hypothetical protein
MVLPSNGSTVSGDQSLDASSSPSVTSVRFELTGGGLNDHVISKGKPTLYGWVGRWNTNTVPNGTYTLKSVATPVDHVSIASAGITISVDNAPTTS